ncbi:hypothetical protein [Nocardia sp. NPDC050793]|uniref:hypothetical protein n=1 Tax=Nocardia sp. NPDC050793 TaxID=3155159 RepID=UPI00340D5143
MTDLSGHHTNVSTRIARGGDHNVVTSRSGWSPRAMSPRCQVVAIHRVMGPAPEQTTPAKCLPLATNFAATQHVSLDTLLLDCDGPATADHLARLKRRPATKDM